jgi:hypothetical protein
MMRARGRQINHPSELNSLILTRPFRKSGRGAIRLTPQFQHPEKEQWEADINRYYYACGCSSGAKGLLLMLVAGVLLGGAAYAADLISIGQALAAPVVGAILGAVIGKLAGLGSARRRLTRVVHTVQAHWKPADKAERPTMICG